MIENCNTQMLLSVIIEQLFGVITVYMLEKFQNKGRRKSMLTVCGATSVILKVSAFPFWNFFHSIFSRTSFVHPEKVLATVVKNRVIGNKYYPLSVISRVDSIKIENSGCSRGRILRTRIRVKTVC